MESNEQSIDSNVEKAASQIHANELRDCKEEDEKEVIKASKDIARYHIYFSKQKGLNPSWELFFSNFSKLPGL